MFIDMTAVANSKSSERKTALMNLFIQCEVVELVKDMWQNYYSQPNSCLPPHIDSSLEVITQL